MSTDPYWGEASHPSCSPETGHVCHKPSGRACVDCGRPAGTSWTAYWCPDCDARRQDEIGLGLSEFAARLEDWSGRVD